MRKELKTRRGHGLGALEDDATMLSRFMDKYGLTQTRLAELANLSQKQISRVLAGEQKLSEPSTDRVMSVFKRLEEKYSVNIDESSPADLWKDLSAEEALISLAGPPRGRVAYEAWKAKQIEMNAAAKELKVAKTWIAHQDKRVAELTEADAAQKEIVSNLKEVASLYKAWVGRLQQQLRDAGLTPTD